MGLLDTFTGFKAVNTSKLMDAFVAHRARPLGHLARDVLRAADRRQAPHRRIGAPRRPGPTWIVAGDAAGSINPFNGEGIAYAYETGRLVADAVHEALATGDGLALARYPERLDERLRRATSRSPAPS